MSEANIHNHYLLDPVSITIKIPHNQQHLQNPPSPLHREPITSIIFRRLQPTSIKQIYQYTKLRSTIHKNVEIDTTTSLRTLNEHLKCTKPINKSRSLTLKTLQYYLASRDQIKYLHCEKLKPQTITFSKGHNFSFTCFGYTATQLRERESLHCREENGARWLTMCVMGEG